MPADPHHTTLEIAARRDEAEENAKGLIAVAEHKAEDVLEEAAKKAVSLRTIGAVLAAVFIVGGSTALALGALATKTDLKAGIAEEHAATTAVYQQTAARIGAVESRAAALEMDHAKDHAEQRVINEYTADALDRLLDQAGVRNKPRRPPSIGPR